MAVGLTRDSAHLSASGSRLMRQPLSWTLGVILQRQRSCSWEPWIKIKMQSPKMIHSIPTINSLLRNVLIALSTRRSQRMNQPRTQKLEEKKMCIVSKPKNQYSLPFCSTNIRSNLHFTSKIHLQPPWVRKPKSCPASHGMKLKDLDLRDGQ